MGRRTFFPNISKPLALGLGVFIIAVLLTQYLAYQRYLIGRDKQRREIIHEINLVKDRLEKSLSYNLSAVKTLAFIVEKYGVPKDFDSIAKNILESNKNIDALELTREGVITHVYPFKDNEAAIGYDILKDSLRNKEAYRAIEKKGLFFAGPLEMKQGGMAVIGRLPIFIENNFWGFSVVIIKLPTLLKAVGIDSLEESEFVFQLSKINPATSEEEYFLPNPYPFNEEQSVSIHVPDGEWKLYAVPKNSKFVYLDALAFSIFGLLLSFIGSLFAWHFAKQPYKLSRLVKETEKNVIKLYKDKETTLNRISDSVVSLDNEWRYTFLNDVALNTHPESREETIGKVIWDVHPEMKGTIFWDKYHEAMEKRKVVETESYYAPMGIWFFVKIYPSSDGLTIFYNDITERKKAEMLIAAEKALSESIVNSLPGVFYLYDKNGKFERWNKNFELISGYKSDEIQNMHPLDFFEGAEKRLLQKKIETVFEKGSSDVRANFYTKGAKKIPYYFNGCKVNFNGIDYLIGMGIDITDLEAAENMLRERTKEIQKLTAHLESIREEERTSIAREIHDELGQQLTGLKMDASWISKRTASEYPAVNEKTKTMIALIDDTIKTVRRIASELRPGILDDLGLMAALEWQTQEFEKRTGIKCQFHSSMPDFNPERNISTNIFRIFQEALTNIIRHSMASKVDIALNENNGYVNLTIKDNGQGFDANEVKSKNSLGLVGMKGRALLFQGELTIKSEKIEGSVITLKIPLLEN